MMKPASAFVRTEHHPFKTCDNFNCPICTKSMAKFKIQTKIHRDKFFGNSPAPFVGRQGYPVVNVGILSPPELTDDAWLYDAPKHWALKSFGIPQIVDYRASLINSRSKSSIKNVSSMIQATREVGMASKPVEVEMFLKGKPIMRMSADDVSAPVGPSAQIKKVCITSNPKIPSKVEKVYSDKDLKAAKAINYLYESGFDENFLTRILSVGTVGLKNNRKLVPTKWSITATDDIIGKRLMTSVKDYKTCSDWMTHFGGYLGNHFIIMFFPEPWGYELFETLAGQANFTTDWEGYDGRKNYAFETAGGYYASRFPVLEKLMHLKRQASVLAIRVITAEYTVPLGCWVVRESARKALRSNPFVFSSKEEMLRHAVSLVRSKFNHDVRNLIDGSKLLDNVKSQQKLTSFL